MLISKKTGGAVSLRAKSSRPQPTGAWSLAINTPMERQAKTTDRHRRDKQGQEEILNPLNTQAYRIQQTTAKANVPIVLSPKYYGLGFKVSVCVINPKP